MKEYRSENSVTHNHPWDPVTVKLGSYRLAPDVYAALPLDAFERVSPG